MLAPSPPRPSIFKRVLDAINPRPPAARPFRDMGVGGTAHYGGYIAIKERSPQWIGAQRYVTISDMAVNASIVAAGVHYFLNLIARPTWTMAPAEGEGVNKSEAEKAAEFVDECINDLAQPWSRVVRRAGTYRFYGFGVQEWTAKRRADGRVGLESVAPRPQATIDRWSISDSGEVEGVWQRSPQSGVELGIPRKKILYLVDDVLSDSPEGVGVFRHLAEPWERLKQYYALEARAFERDLRGTPIGRVPYTMLREAVENNDLTAAEAKALTAEMEKFVKLQVKQSDTAITLDSIPYYSQAADGAKAAGLQQWGLELLSGGAAGMAEVAAAIVRTQTEMARLLTVEHLMMGESSGNRALSEDKSKNLYLISNAVLQDIAAGVQQDIVPAICDLNGIPEELYPQCEVEDVSRADAADVADVLAKMAQAGATLQLDDPIIEDVRSLMGMSPPPPPNPEMMGLPAGEGGEDEDEDEEDTAAPKDSAEGDEEEVEGDEVSKTIRGLFKRYDPNQPRRQKGGPEGGRWTSAGSGISSEGAAAALLEKNSDASVTFEDVVAGLTPQQREMMDAARAAVAAGTSTRDQFLQADGKYTPEREALHEKIIGEMFSSEAVAAATPAAGERPELVLTGGRSAAGKTSALRAGGIDAGPPKYIYVSTDEIQEKLPGYSGARASLYNPEGQDIADKAEAFGRKLGVNMVFDATMKTQKTAAARVVTYGKAGYDVSAYFVHTAPHTAARRTVERFVRSGRFTPPEIPFNSTTNEATFDALTPRLRRWAIFDNNGASARLVRRSW